MAKKLIYKITRYKMITVEVETIEEEKIVEELNRDTDRFEKSEETFQNRVVSLDKLFEESGFEPVYDEATPEEIYIQKELQKGRRKRILRAMDKLTEKQKTVIYKTYWEDKTLREIADELGVAHITVYKILEAAKKKIKKN
ncbi:MAG: hypothetical protein IKJ13_05735 [Clostridia bacterium]|nr:hypothetical protein [Clostridia bacterium]